MKASWAIVTPPAVDVLTLIEAKQHAKILYNDDDAVIYRFIRTATEAAEEALQRGLYTQTWQLSLSHFAEVMYLPMAAPLQNDPDASTEPIVQYYDADGVLQTLDSTYYTVDTSSRPGSIVRASSMSWPTLQSDRQSMRVFITYVVGWTSIDLIPERIKQGMRTYVAYLDCDREGLEENAERALSASMNCWLDRVSWIEPAHWHWYRDARW